MSTDDLDDKTTPGKRPPRVGAVEDGEVLAGRYRLVRFVAAGGMGEVWEAEDLSLHEHVALKTVRPDALDAELLERFRHEVKLARRVTHPNVCRIFEFGEHVRPEGPKVSFLTMELLSGRSLDDELRRTGPMSVAQALPLLEQMAAGLDAAHAQGIVHRDFKSPNVFLEGTRVVITDFGLARAVGADVRVTTNPQQMMGTPAYMAPEQVLGSGVGPAADVFALGVVAFELVTGRLPFQAETALATALKRLSEPPLSARSLVPSLPAHWERALFVALSRKPEDRFASASKFVEALRAPTLPARRPSRTGWLWLGLPVALAAGGMTWQSFHSTPTAPAAGKSELEAAVRSVTKAVQRCHEVQLAKTADLEGLLEFRVEIDARGERINVTMERDTMGSPEVAACAMTELRAITPTPALAGSSVVYPFVFKSTSPIAIAPFENLTGRADIDWLSGGMSEALSSKLGQLGDVPLVNRTELRARLAAPAADGGVNTPLSVARSIGAGRLIRGSFQQLGGKLRINAELVDVTREVTRASVEVTGAVDDVFSLQDSLAKKLAEALAVERTRATEQALDRQTAGSLAVLQLLGKASNALNGTNEPADPKKAIALYRQVIELEPNVAEAHLGLAWALWAEDRTAGRILDPIGKALSLRPDYYEALTFLGFTLWHEGRFEESLEAQRKAVKLKPNFGDGYYGLAIAYASTGKVDEAFVALDRAIELSPRNGEYLAQRAALMTVFHRDQKEAVALADRAVTLEPENGWPQVIRAYVHLFANDPPGCFEALQAHAATHDARKQWGLARAIEVGCLIRAGRLDEARAARAALPQQPARQARGFEKLSVEALMQVLDELDAGR